MTTIQIQTFLTAAELLSFSAAADRLMISQSAVSRQIQAMEQELGTTLFQRQGNTIRLTMTGETFHQKISALQGEYTALVAHIRQLTDGSAGFLRIGLLEDQLLPDRLLHSLREMAGSGANRRRRITLLRLSAEELYEELSGGRLDAACMIFQDDSIPDGMSRQIQSEEAICLAAAKWLQFGPIPDQETFYNRLETLGVLPVMLREDYFEKAVRNRLAEIRQLERDYSLVSGVEALEPMVSAGFAVTFVNESNRLVLDPQIELIPVPFSPSVKKGLMWLTDHTNPLLTELLQRMEA